MLKDNYFRESNDTLYRQLAHKLVKYNYSTLDRSAKFAQTRKAYHFNN